MAVYNLFSKRQRAQTSVTSVPLSYDRLPDPLRVQIVQIWLHALGDQGHYNSLGNKVRSTYDFLVEALCHEYGVFRLPESKNPFDDTSLGQLVTFFGQTRDISRALDVIEITFRAINRFSRFQNYLYRVNASEIADEAITDLNHRLQEHGVGYRFVDDQIVRIDSELVHREIVAPALQLLTGSQYAGAQQEYLKAHEHYRRGDGKEAMTECAKSLESLMKAICLKRRWPHDPNSTAKQLITICFERGLIPAFWQGHFSSLRSMLESSVPTGRNKLAAHGQDTTPTESTGLSRRLHAAHDGFDDRVPR